VSGIAVALLWAWIFAPDFGLLNYLLSLVGITGPAWLFDTKWSMPAIIIMSLWGVGGIMLIYLAGLQNVPRELYEAAEVDGAGRLQRIWYITIPMITPVIFFTLITSIIASFQTWSSVLVMTNGGPANSTLLYNLYLYRKAFQQSYFGLGSAMAWLLFILILAITLTQFALAKHWVYYEGQLRGR
jgi:multiple sugar transport system permease protein